MSRVEEAKFSCNNCGKSYKWKPEFAGRKVKCKCGYVMTAPAAPPGGDEPDLARMQQQLSAILDYIDQLNQLNTDGVEPLAHPLPVQNVFRPDEPRPSLPLEEALAGAPEVEADRFKVPRIVEQG